VPVVPLFEGNDDDDDRDDVKKINDHMSGGDDDESQAKAVETSVIAVSATSVVRVLS
jgi:hypothetical protein